ncbi:IS110 family transposase [Peribacillus simplex]|nr:IS110 family transposase [Peribacillus simplex]
MERGMQIVPFIYRIQFFQSIRQCCINRLFFILLLHEIGDFVNCTHVAMESTSVYWKPIVNLLESEGIEFLVVNAQHMKALPGPKTDVKDAEWIAQLLRHGLLKASFIPDRNQRELRELVRYRRSIIEERARQHNRIQKVLEGANIKLGSVVSDIMGVSSKDMLRAIANGEDTSKPRSSYNEAEKRRTRISS